MREIVLTVAGLIIGGFFGVTLMCLFQINKDRHYFISRKDDKELVRYNYKFIPESDKVEISNKDFYDVISYDDWLHEYYIVDKCKTLEW